MNKIININYKVKQIKNNKYINTLYMNIKPIKLLIYCLKKINKCICIFYSF